MAKKPSLKLTASEKYALYETAVQSPETHVTLFEQISERLGNGKPSVLREDFCGTAQIATEWVRRGTERKAIGLDLDPEPLEYAHKNHLKDKRLKERVKLIEQNVVSITSPKADVVAACNFSFYIFQQRSELKKYFKSVHQSLSKNGVFVMEMVGGPGFIAKATERRTLTHPKLGKFKYFWNQRKFDPIHSRGFFAIHFEKNGKKAPQTFTYDWRLWTIPEVREILIESGFSKSFVLWEDEEKPEYEGGYYLTEKGTNDITWGAIIVGKK